MKIELLKNVLPFSELSDQEIRGILKRSKKRTLSSGIVVIYEGDPGDAIYLILRGKVKVVLSNPMGKEIILNTLNSGDYFGEMSVFDHMSRSANIVAMEDCEFLIIPRDALTDQIKKNPQLALKLLSVMSQRLRDSNEQISSLAYLDVRSRVIRRILQLLKKSSEVTTDGYQVIPRPAMKDLADMVAASRETVSRILNNLVKDGVISLVKDRIIIHEDLVDENFDVI